jgi:hypothetical protein
MDLEDRLILAGQLELDRVAMVLGADALLEAERAEERDVLLEAITISSMWSILVTAIAPLLPPARYTLKVDFTAW